MVNFMDLKYNVVDNKYTNVIQVLKQEFSISSRLYLKLKNANQIFVNGEPLSYSNENIQINDIIEVDLKFVENNSNIVPTKMDLDILYEDEYLLIVNKPAGFAIHPSLRHYETSISNGVKYYYDSINLHRKIRIVNRLDKDTSGIVIFAKNEYVQECLVKQMKNNIFEKKYIAFIEGHLPQKEGSIYEPIARKQNSIIERCVDENGDMSITHYRVLQSNLEKNIDIVECRLETGRTHQIRVHFSYIGHPLLGDTLYGESSNLINRQALHAYKVSFIHPITKNILEIETEIPDDMKDILK